MKKKININESWTMDYVRLDTFYSIIPIPRLLALKAVITGKTKLTWKVPATKKYKRLIIYPDK